MAITKSIETAFGIDATYWAIESFRKDPESSEFILNGWASEGLRRTNMAPISRMTITIPNGLFDFSKPMHSQLYHMLKTQIIGDDRGVFYGAEDA